MNKIKIFIDSTGDLPKDLRDKYDIDYCPMVVTVDDKEVIASLDYDQGYTLKQFYDVMREGRRIFTSQVPDHVFVEKFTAALKDGFDILYIGCSSKLSASVLAGEKVALGLRKEFPNNRIVVFDSKISCYGQGEMAIIASKMRKEGKTLDEIEAWLSLNIFKFNQFATVDSLLYLKRAGRVSATSAFFGNIFGVKPILISDRLGQNLAIEKIKGTKQSLLYLAKAAVEAGEDLTGKTIFIGHADAIKAAEFVRDEILKLAPGVNIYIGPIGPIVGASTGPGTIGVYVFGKEVAANNQ
ncbi:MAG: DegV family protein [Erysipelotrichaceae bacterium]|nr:DegV family protein [Erysipelotrichaceae bacterium]